MRAADLAEPYPVVGLDSDALAAATTLGVRRLVGLIVCDDGGQPYTVLPGSQVLQFVIPAYVQDDPALARVYDEDASDELCRRLSGKRVRDVLPRKQDLHDLPVVDDDATSIEVAAVMARMHSPLVAVVHGEEIVGAITVSRLLQYLLPDSNDG